MIIPKWLSRKIDEHEAEIVRLKDENGRLKIANARLRNEPLYEPVVEHQDPIYFVHGRPRVRAEASTLSPWRPLDYRWGKPTPRQLARSLRKVALTASGSERWHLIAAAEALDEGNLEEIRLYGT